MNLGREKLTSGISSVMASLELFVSAWVFNNRLLPLKHGFFFDKGPSCGQKQRQNACKHSGCLQLTFPSMLMCPSDMQIYSSFPWKQAYG